MALDLKNIDVFILCGGLGKRLREVSDNMPKPMAQVGGRPFLDIIIDYMANFGFRRFILGLGYKADMIKAYYRKRKKSKLEILFSCEKVPLDTGGAVKNAKRLISSNLFLVLNGDSFCKFNPLGFLEFHKQKKSLISILLRKTTKAKDYGEVKVDRFWRILNFNEKNAKAKKCLINAGVYLFDKKIFNLMPRLSKFSLEFEFFPRMAKKKIFGYPYSGFFIDIGTPERYSQAIKYFLKNN
jgi:NDP-sugar pyrophosphorylase family protein